MRFVETPSFKLAVYSQGNKNAEKLALVLPGRLDTKDYAHMRSHVDFLAEQGFYALSFDPPYSWESPGDIANYSTTNYIKAVNELIEHFGDKPTLLVGHSRGGAAAMLVSAQNPHVIALVLAMANYSVPTPPNPDRIQGDVLIESRDLPPGSQRTVEQKEFRLPLAYFEDAKQYKPAEALKQFKGPKLIICGTRDTFITPEKVKETFSQLTEPKMLLELDTEHDYRLHREMVEAVNNAIGELIKTSVK
ncbi:MAG: alpha/beta fold hydrolase [Patescibacteria group bacterium]